MRLNFKRFGNVKLAISIATLLFLIWLLQPTLFAWMGNGQNPAVPSKSEINLNQAESMRPATPTVPAQMPGVDPFKAHIEKNGLATSSVSNSASNLQSNVGSTNNSGNANSANQSGADPFKAFLDKQKQQSKEASVSPFGK
jgi:hypothetical protein